jgi:uncharacterized spore protein YtfJ
MVCGQNHIKLLPVNVNSSVEKILDMVPDLVERANELLKSKMTNKKDECGKKNQNSYQNSNQNPNQSTSQNPNITG